MELKQIEVASIYPFTADYQNGIAKATNYFPFDYHQQDSLVKRAEYLQTKQFARNELADHITSYMERFGTSEAVAMNIDALRKDALVVIGGQQAGVLTGPLYTLHKIISIICIAKQQSKQLNRKVIPVFWIAGEDHDFQEVNHVYLKNDLELIKKVFPYQPASKPMISDMVFDQEATLNWLTASFKELGETEHTNRLLDWLMTVTGSTTTLTEWFAQIVFDLFKEYGLLFVDSGEVSFRKLASSTYVELLNQSDAIAAAINEAQQAIIDEGYQTMIETAETSANLFFYAPEQKERLLLSYKKDQYFSKNREVVFEKGQLLEIAQNHPEYLSTNVVTRPIMQERLFPVLSFIAGPGEVAYWAEISKAFTAMNEKMPLVLPRLSFTLVERNTTRLLNELGLSLEEVIEKGCQSEKQVFVDSLLDHDLEPYYLQTKQVFLENHATWQQAARNKDQTLTKLFDKNREIITKQLDFIQQKMIASHLRVHQEEIHQYDEVTNLLHPLGGPQERTLNPFYFFNKYGLDWLDFLLRQEGYLPGKHYLLSL